MIVKEAIEFKRGKDTKEALGVGMKEAYRVDPDKYLQPAIREYLERSGLYHDPRNGYLGPINPNFTFLSRDKIGDKYKGEFYINLQFTLPIDDYDDRTNFRKSFTKFLREKANFMITRWSSEKFDSLYIKTRRETIGKYFTKFDITIEPREQERYERY